MNITANKGALLQINRTIIANERLESNLDKIGQST
jgi:hypothetical protein